MKKKEILFITVFAFFVILAGCITIGTDSDKTTNLNEVGNDRDASNRVQADNAMKNSEELSQELETTKTQLGKCLTEKETCLAKETISCPDPIECNTTTGDAGLNAQLSACNTEKDSFEGLLTDCTTAKNLLTVDVTDLNTSLNTCTSNEATCTASLSTCETDKTVCETDLVSALAAAPNAVIKHYVQGNLSLESGTGYYTKEFGFLLSAPLKTAVIGLDYTGGNDPFFSSSVTTTYGLNRVIWITLTTTDGGATFTSNDASERIKIEGNGNHLKIKQSEYTAETSEEGLAIRRIIAIYLTN